MHQRKKDSVDLFNRLKIKAHVSRVTNFFSIIIECKYVVQDKYNIGKTARSRGLSIKAHHRAQENLNFFRSIYLYLTPK